MGAAELPEPPEPTPPEPEPEPDPPELAPPHWAVYCTRPDIWLRIVGLPIACT